MKHSMIFPFQFCILGICFTIQGRNEVRWRPGQETRLSLLCSKLRSFGSKTVLLKKVLATFLELFGVPRSDSALGELRAPLATPLVLYIILL